MRATTVCLLQDHKPKSSRPPASQLSVGMCMCAPLSHVWLCYPLDCSLPGFSVHGILQARILEWVNHSHLQGIFPTQASNPVLHCRQILYHLSHLESPKVPVAPSVWTFLQFYPWLPWRFRPAASASLYKFSLLPPTSVSLERQEGMVASSG